MIAKTKRLFGSFLAVLFVLAVMSSNNGISIFATEVDTGESYAEEYVYDYGDGDGETYYQNDDSEFSYDEADDGYYTNELDSEDVEYHMINEDAIEITIIGIAAVSRAYDGSLLVELTGGELYGVEQDDDVSFILGYGSVAEKNVGNDLVVVTNITLTGEDSYRYVLIQPTDIIVNISPKELTITGVTAVNRAYDGTVFVELSGGRLIGVEQDIDVYFELGGGTISSRNAGSNLPVTAEIALVGAESNNFVLRQPMGITVNIAPKEITISYVVATNRFFAFNDAVALGGGRLNDVLLNDDVSFVLGDGVATRQRGTLWNVATDIRLTGVDARNYILIQPHNVQVEITIGPNTSIVIVVMLGVIVIGSATLAGVWLYKKNKKEKMPDPSETQPQHTGIKLIPKPENTIYHIQTPHGESDQTKAKQETNITSPVSRGIVLLDKKPTPIIEAVVSTENAAHCKHKLFLSRQAVKELHQHICWGESNRLNLNEQQGILVGRIVCETNSGNYIGVVEHVILSKAQGSAAYVESSHSEWNDMVKELDRLNVGKSEGEKFIKVGWWHTHPNMGIFMSGTDQDTQRKYYNKDWQFAIVLNPQAKRWGVFIGANATPCEGFFLT